jgi:hypothetical protein
MQVFAKIELRKLYQLEKDEINKRIMIMLIA